MKKILFGLFIFGFLLISYNVQAVDDTDSCVISSFTVDGSNSTTVSISEGALLEWKTSGCSSVLIYPLSSDTPFPLTGEQQLYHPQTRDYVLTAYGFNGDSVSKSVHVTTSTMASPQLVILSPNSGFESIEYRKKVEIRWTTTNIVGAMFNVYVSDGIHKGEVVNTSNTGSLIYTLGENLIPGSNYKAYIVMDTTDDYPLMDSSDNSFTIKPANSGCLNGEVFSSTTGAICTTTPYKITITTDLTPRISYWQGKVNQHVSVSEGMWQTDSDGVSGAEIDKLTYCKKFYPNTTSVIEYKKEYINAWHDRGNVNDYLGLNMSYQCVEINTGCSNGQVYNSTTGQVCPVTTEQGCNGTKYSTTTGGLCSNYVTTEEGCNGYNKYSKTTGGICNNYVVVEKGCNGTMYSTTTGALCPVMATTAGDVSISRTLKVGVKGDDVKALQTLLGINSDGSFGPVTMQKVMEWQAQNGLTPDGVFGHQSRVKAGFED